MITPVPYVKKILPEERGGRILFDAHVFQKGHHGTLEHYTDGTLRATVEPEHMSAFVEVWPDAAPVAAYIKGGHKTLKVKKGKK